MVIDLRDPPPAITVADVIAAMEGDLAMTECCESIVFALSDSMCTMRENWQKINTEWFINCYCRIYFT